MQQDKLSSPSTRTKIPYTVHKLSSILYTLSSSQLHCSPNATAFTYVTLSSQESYSAKSMAVPSFCGARTLALHASSLHISGLDRAQDSNDHSWATLPNHARDGKWPAPFSTPLFDQSEDGSISSAFLVQGWPHSRLPTTLAIFSFAYSIHGLMHSLRAHTYLRSKATLILQ